MSRPEALPWPQHARYIGQCCREWVLIVGIGGRCGLCGTAPTYKRPFDPTEPPPHPATNVSQNTPGGLGH